jgi:hypothetical protein
MRLWEAHRTTPNAYITRNWSVPSSPTRDTPSTYKCRCFQGDSDPLAAESLLPPALSSRWRTLTE